MRTFLLFMPLPKPLRVVLTLPLRGVLSGLGALCCAQAIAEPKLTCQVTYAGATHTVVARPVADPYPVPSVDIAGRFQFKAVLVGDATRLMVAAGADAVIGGHPHVTQDIEHIDGKPVIYSVGNFVMKETDNAHQRRGWALRLVLDAQGVRLLDTRVAQIRMDGVPERDDRAASPCWQRGDAAVGQCVAGQRLAVPSAESRAKPHAMSHAMPR